MDMFKEYMKEVGWVYLLIGGVIAGIAWFGGFDKIQIAIEKVFP